MSPRHGRGWLLAVAAALMTAACGGPAGALQPGSATTSHGSVPPQAGVGDAGSVAPAAPTSPAASRSLSAARPLAGMVVGIDPGHNGLNGSDPAYLNQIIWNGRQNETCDTAGTQTAGGYTEARFNFNVARYLRAGLIAAGARVVLTRTSNHGAGPCVDRRARILDRAHANVAIDIHADGGPAWGRGFTVLEPVADGPNDKVIASSVRFGADVHAALLRRTSMPVSDYYGSNGYAFRNDLAGLNLTTVPKVLVECGNMPNATDAAMLTSPRFQKRLAAAFEAAIVTFLSGR